MDIQTRSGYGSEPDPNKKHPDPQSRAQMTHKCLPQKGISGVHTPCWVQVRTLAPYREWPGVGQLYSTFTARKPNFIFLFAITYIFIVIDYMYLFSAGADGFRR